MNRNEVFAAGEVARLEPRLAWATLEIGADDVENVQVLVSGSDAEVEDLKISLEGGTLSMEQPSYGLTPRIDLVRWMQVSVRLPRSWRGAVTASTITGPLRARGLEGTDISLETVSGDLRASDIRAIDAKIHTVTGRVLCAALESERLGLRTISGAMQLEGLSARQVRLGTVSGDCLLTFAQPFQSLEGTSVSGDISVNAPMAELALSTRGMASRVSLDGISQSEDAAARVSLTLVTGRAAFFGTAGAQGKA